MENYHLYRLGIWLVAHLPVGFSYFVAALVAELNFLFNTRSRRGVYANQSAVLPPRTPTWRRWVTARCAFRYFAYSVVDFFRIPTMRRTNLDRFVGRFEGWEYLEAAMAKGVGGIFATVHMGSWELGGAYLGHLGLPLTAVALPHKDPRIERVFARSRATSGIEVVPVGGALRKLQDALINRRFIAMVVDRDVTGHGGKLPFFGRPTRLPHGHATLALRTGAWLFPTVVYRLPDGHSGIRICEPIIPDPEHDTAESLSLGCMAVLETFIRRWPHQWSSFYDLWDDTELPVA
jgi:lauroyl/myristoyl acyltransferase